MHRQRTYVQAESPEAFERRMGIDAVMEDYAQAKQGFSFEEGALESYIASITDTKMIQKPLRAGNTYKLAEKEKLTSYIPSIKSKGSLNQGFFAQKKSQEAKLIPPQTSESPLYEDSMEWLVATMDTTSKMSERMSPIYEKLYEKNLRLSKASSTRAARLLWSSFENPHSDAVPFWNAQKNMETRAQGYYTSKSAKYAFFKNSVNKLKVLGKVAVAIDVVGRLNTINDAKEEIRSKVAFQEGVVFTVESFVDPIVGGAVIGGTSGIGTIVAIPAIVLANSIIEPSVKWSAGKVYDFYEWESKKWSKG